MRTRYAKPPPGARSNVARATALADGSDAGHRLRCWRGRISIAPPPACHGSLSGGAHQGAWRSIWFGPRVERLYTGAGYRGHNAPPEYKFKVYTAKQKRRVTPHIKREMRRRSAIEPVIGHLKNEHRMDRNYLAGRHGDASNAILAAVGYNFRRLIRWLTLVFALVLLAISTPPKSANA